MPIGIFQSWLLSGAACSRDMMSAMGRPRKKLTKAQAGLRGALARKMALTKAQRSDVARLGGLARMAALSADGRSRLARLGGLARRNSNKDAVDAA